MGQRFKRWSQQIVRGFEMHEQGNGAQSISINEVLESKLRGFIITYSFHFWRSGNMGMRI